VFFETSVLVHFENTPKAFANFSPGFERSENPVSITQLRFKPERVRLNWNPYRVQVFFYTLIPRLSLCSNRWAEISERLRRIPN
jgi:hypothetical protein